MSAEINDYEKWIRPIEDRMMRSVWRILRNPDDAEEAFQNAMEQIWKKRGKLHRHPNPQAFVLRLCVTAAYDTLRKRLRQNRYESASEIPDAPDTSPIARQSIDDHRREGEIHSAISRLSRTQGIAVLMRIVEDEPYERIAQSLGCSESTARIHVHRGRDRLRKMLAHLAPNLKEEVRR